MADDPKNTNAMEKALSVQNQQNKDIDFSSLSFDGLLTHIRFRDLEEVLQKIDVFLQSRDEELDFPGIYKACEEILVRIVQNVNVLNCPKLPTKCSYYAKRIMKAINNGESQRKYIVVCVYKSEKRRQSGLRARYENVLVYKRVFYSLMAQSRPSKSRPTGSNVSSSSSTHESRSSSVDSDTPRSSLHKNNFISHCLQLILQFVKDNNQLNLEFTELNRNDSEFLHTFFSSIVESNFDDGLGGKNLFVSLWEAVKVFSLKYEFNIRYVENENEDMSLLLEKNPKTKKQPKTELPSSTTKIPPNVKAKQEKNKRKKKGLAKVIDDLSSEFLTHTLKKMLDFLSDEMAASVAFSTLDAAEKRFLKNISTCINSHHMQYGLDHEVQRLFEQVQALIKENDDYKLSKCVRKRGDFEKEVIYTKTPKFDGPVRLTRSWYSPSHNSSEAGNIQHSEWSTTPPLLKGRPGWSQLVGYSPINFKPARVQNKGNATVLVNEKDPVLMAALRDHEDDMLPILSHGELWLPRRDIQSGEAQTEESQSGEAQRAEIGNNEIQMVDIQNREGKMVDNNSGEAQKVDNKSEAQKAENKTREVQKSEIHSGEASKEQLKIAPTNTKSNALKRANTPIGYGAVAKRNVQLIEALSVPVQSEKAIRMMKSMGWKGGALGSKENGITEPIMPPLNRGTGAGLGHVKQKCSVKNLPKATPATPLLNEVPLLGLVPINQTLCPINMSALPPATALGYHTGTRTASQFRQSIFTYLLTLLRSTSDEITIQINPPLKLKEANFMKYIMHTLALRQRVSLEAEHCEILDAITAEYKKYPGMAVTACTSNSKREVVLKKVQNHAVLQPKLNKKQLRDMQRVEPTIDPTANLQEFVDKHSAMWRNKRNSDKLVFKLEFYAIILNFVKKDYESFLKVEFINALAPKHGKFLMSFFEQVNRKTKFGSTIPEMTMSLHILKYMGNYQIVLGKCGDDFLTASKKYIYNTDQPAASSTKTINNNVIKFDDFVKNIKSSSEEKQDYTYKFIKQVYYGDPTCQELAERDNEIISNPINAVTDYMSQKDCINAQPDIVSTGSNQIINTSDDINVSDDKIISDNKSDVSGMEISKAANEVTNLAKDDENSDKIGNNVTENSDYTSEYMIDEMSVSGCSAYTDYYSEDDAQDIAMDGDVIKICDDDDIIKISDDEDRNVKDDLVKMGDNAVEIFDNEIKILDTGKTIDEVKMANKEVKTVDEEVKMLEKTRLKIVEEGILVDDSIKMVGDEESNVDDRVKMADDSVSVFYEAVQKLNEEVTIINDEEILKHEEETSVDNVEKRIDEGVNLNECRLKIDDVSVIDDEIKMADRIETLIGEGVNMVEEGITVAKHGVEMGDDTVKMLSEGIKMNNDGTKLVVDVVNVGEKNVDDTVKIYDKVLKISDDVEDNEVNLNSGVVNIDNDKTIFTCGDGVTEIGKKIEIKDEEIETGDEGITTDDNGIECDKMLDISLKSESLKAMLNIDVVENQSHSVVEMEKSKNDVKIVYLSKDYFLAKDMPNYIQGLISLNIMHTKVLPLLKCHGVQDGALVYSCHTKKSYDWLITVCVTNNIKINTKDFDKMRLKINTYFKFDDKYFFNMLELYNREVSTRDWVIMKKEHFDNHVIFDIKMDAKSFKFILDSNMELYAGIDKVTFCIIYA